MKFEHRLDVCVRNQARKHVCSFVFSINHPIAVMTVFHVGTLLSSLPIVSLSPLETDSSATVETHLFQVLFKIKSSLTSAEEASHLAEWTARGHAMVSQIPGLQSLELGKGLAQSLHRGQGFTHGLVAVLDGPADLPVSLGCVYSGKMGDTESCDADSAGLRYPPFSSGLARNWGNSV